MKEGKKVDSQQKVNLLILSLIVYMLAMAFYVDSFAKWLATAPFLLAVTIYIVAHPAYILIIWGLVHYNQNMKLRAFISGMVLSTALEIISLPRLSSTGFINTDLSTLTMFDSIFARAALETGFNHTLFYWTYYVILPIALLMICIKLLGYNGFWGKIKGLMKG